MDIESIDPARDTATTAEIAAALGLVALLAGLVIGASGPLVIVVASPFFAAGPTWGGLALALGGAAAVVSGFTACAIRRGRWWVVPTFAASASLVLGILLGSRLGPALGM